MLKHLSLSRFFLYLIIAAALVLNVDPHAAIAQDKKTLTIFAASSLTDAFKAFKTAFEQANPTAEIVYNFGSSSTLATQLAQGAPADIFASANAKQMSVAQDAKRIAGSPRTFAKNRLVLIVPADNPAKITSIKDLAKPGVKLVIAAPNVPVRDYTDAMIAKLLKVPGYGDPYKAAFTKNVVSEEENVRQVSAKVALGEADAGLVYRSDVTPDIASKVTAIAIPDAVNTIATYPIAITDNSPNADLAQKYIDYVLSVEGQKTLVKWNFISSAIPVLPAKIALPTDGALHIDGQVLNPLKLTVDDLKNSYTAQKVDVTYLSGDKSVTASFTGVYLRDLLDAVQVNFNADVKNDKISLFIIGTGSDGYQATIAYAELDPDFGNQPIIVAYEQDGKPIADKEGAIRLIVPGDKRGGRYVSGLVSLEVRDAPGVSK
ncbi:MAG: molybdate ABC transporter substrate-binding protein [Chloroflexota bacterium]